MESKEQLPGASCYRAAFRRIPPERLFPMEPLVQILAQDSSPDAAEAAAVLGLAFGFVAILLVVSLLISVVVTWLIWDSYKTVPQQFQKLPAGLVWLCVIPCFGAVMFLVTAILVPLAFKDAFASRGRTEFGDCGLAFGIAWIACALLSAIPVLGVAFSLGSLICMILFIVKLRQMKSAMLTA
jgi:hypothetical protein